MRVTRTYFFTLLFSFAVTLPALTAESAMPASDCLVIAHRGASGYLPEHTLAAYELAMQQGADYIEPDIVLTKDGVPVARHESLLQLSTDVADRPEFAARKRAAVLGGRSYEGWFIEDFTLAELRTLRATERYPDTRPKNREWAGIFPVPTLQEIIDLVRSFEGETGRAVGLYPELKQVAYFEARNLDPVDTVLTVLAENGLNEKDSPVILQSFEPDVLQALAERSELPRVLLLGGNESWKVRRAAQPEFLAEVAAFADGIGVPKYGYALQAEDNRLPTELVSNAHVAGLKVHVYTLRAENRFLPDSLRSSELPSGYGDIEAELDAVVSAGVDGFFIDQPDIGRRFCDRHNYQTDTAQP